MNSPFMTADPNSQPDRVSPLSANILVVDDQPENLSVLMGVLQARGYKVRPVNSGKLALAAARVQPPDLILLDINMPEMSGYEVCVALRADPNLRPIPIIFISAFNEASDKVKGFGLGAVDYVTKPFQIEEVEARVSTHLELAHLRRQLERHNERLVEEVAVRTCELAAAHTRLSVLDEAKSDFLKLIAYELRAPLCGVIGTAEIILDNYTREPGAAEQSELARVFGLGRKRVLTLIEDAELLTEIGLHPSTNPATQCELEPVVNQALRLALPLADSRNVKLSPPPLGLGWVRGSSAGLVRAFQSLFETAAKLAKPGTTVRLAKALKSPASSLIIEAEGWTIPPEGLPRFFSLMVTANPIALGVDLDLSPALAERILRLSGGTVSVENLDPPGIRLTVCLEPLPA